MSDWRARLEYVGGLLLAVLVVAVLFVSNFSWLWTTAPPPPPSIPLLVANYQAFELGRTRGPAFYELTGQLSEFTYNGCGGGPCYTRAEMKTMLGPPDLESMDPKRHWVYFFGDGEKRSLYCVVWFQDDMTENVGFNHADGKNWSGWMKFGN